MENYGYGDFDEQVRRNQELEREYNSLKAASAQCRYGAQDCASCMDLGTCMRGQFLAARSR